MEFIFFMGIVFWILSLLGGQTDTGYSNTIDPLQQKLEDLQLKANRISLNINIDVHNHDSEYFEEKSQYVKVQTDLYEEYQAIRFSVSECGWSIPQAKMPLSGFVIHQLREQVAFSKKWYDAFTLRNEKLAFWKGKVDLPEFPYTEDSVFQTVRQFQKKEESLL